MTNPIIKRGAIHTVVGVQVDELQLSLFCNANVVVANVPLTQFARQGGFDGARLTVTRNFSKYPGGASCGSLSLFKGRVGPLTVSGTEVAMHVKSDLELLDVAMPRNVYMAQCQHTLYDTGCSLNPAGLTVTGNTTTGATTTNVSCNLAQADGYFELGVMKFTSGQNNQVQRSIRIYTSGYLVPVQPWPITPAAGDRFTVRPGCDKLLSTCGAKFANSANFRGYPFIPAPETSY